jgi:hypothetical protein
MARWRVLALALALVACAVDGGERGDEGDPIHSPATPGSPVASSDGATGLSAAAVARFSETALTRACVSLDAAARVVAIDGVACQRIAESAFCTQDCDDWASCGGCLMYLNRGAGGGFTLEARRRSSDCRLYDGVYQLDRGGRSCTAPPSAPSAHAGAAGELIEAYAPGARARICVTSAADGSVERIDELECARADFMHECAPGDCPWVSCGGCLLHVERESSGATLLEARLASGGCSALAGAYCVDPTISCN